MLRALTIVCVLATAAAAEPAGPDQAAPPASDHRYFGVGYKLGNGIGFLGGDLVVNPIDHLSIDLYAAYNPILTSDGTSASGFAMAPAIQYELFGGQRSTPYAAVGLQYVHDTIGDLSISGTGGFANLGWEWKWKFGLGVQLGGGVQYLGKKTETTGNTMLTIGGGLNANLEAGVRYMFF
jgi:hypothetical protein